MADEPTGTAEVKTEAPVAEAPKPSAPPAEAKEPTVDWKAKYEAEKSDWE